MKITNLRLYPVAPRWLFLAIDTDAGVVGWGEPVIEGRAQTVAAAVNELAPYLVGKDPRQINDLWQTLYRGGFYRGGPILMSAIAGIDQALQAQGWDTFKLNGCGKLKMIDSYRAVEQVIARVATIRENFGSSIDFGLDFHGRVSVPMAKVLLKELEPYHPLFVEEPVLAEQSEQYAILSRQTSIVLAAGERMYSRFDFKSVFEAGGLGIVQPDVSHAGGITECLKIASMAEAYDVALAPHCPLGPIALAACLAVDFVSHNAVLQEQSMGIHYNQGAELLDYVLNKDDFAMIDGHIKPLPKPGLGVEVDEQAVIAASKIACDWKNPLWRHSDGSIAEW